MDMNDDIILCAYFYGRMAETFSQDFFFLLGDYANMLWSDYKKNLINVFLGRE